MGKPVTSKVQRVATTSLNTKIDAEVFGKFKDYCAYRGYSMNVLLETFMLQYSNNKFPIEHDDIMKWKDNKESDIETLNTTFNKEIYHNFKLKCRKDGYFVKHVIMAFMEELSSKTFILEYVEVK